MPKIVGLHLVLLLAGMATAQDRHFPPLHPTAPRNVPPPRPFRRPFPIIGAGFGWGGYAAGSPEPGPVVNNFLMVEQSSSPAAPPQPPEPIRSSIQDFKPPASDAPPAFFVIALKNGFRLAAAAVWIQGNDLRYVDADDQNRRVPLSDVDRTATRQINQARNLNLRLPPPAQ